MEERWNRLSEILFWLQFAVAGSGAIFVGVQSINSGDEFAGYSWRVMVAGTLMLVIGIGALTPVRNIEVKNVASDEPDQFTRDQS